MVSSGLEIDAQRRELLAEVAILTYEQGLTQQEVADRIGVSRSTVSRLLDEARRKRVVEIYINTPFRRSAELQARLCERFGLKEARVLISDSATYEGMLKRLGEFSASYVRTLLQDDTVIGVAWGVAPQHLVRGFRPLDRDTRIVVVKMLGSIGALDQDTIGTNLAHDLAQLVRGRYYDLPAPMLVDNPRLRDALIKERDISQVLALAEQADIAIVGIGSTVPGYNTPERAGYLREEDMRQLREADAVGDILSQYFDTHGQVLPIDLNSRVIGLTLDKLREIPFVIGVAGGEVKAAAILGALRGGHVNVLLTDDVAANKVLELDEASHR